MGLISGQPAAPILHWSRDMEFRSGIHHIESAGAVTVLRFAGESGVCLFI